MSSVVDERSRTLVRRASDMIVVVDSRRLVRFATGACETVLGVAPSDLAHSQLLDRVHPDDLEPVRSFLTAALVAPGAARPSGSWRMLHADGTWINLDVVAANLLDEPSVDGLVLTCRDVSPREALEEHLRHRAFHDPLTQLPNRALLHERIEHALARAGRTIGLLFVDLDDFKVVNDTLGHAAGDGVLVSVATRLRGCLRSADTAGRFGGDEFAVLLEEVSGAEECLTVSGRILDAMRRPFIVHGESVQITVSVGVAVVASGALDVGEVLRRADYAMYSAKRNGKGRAECFDLAADCPPLEHFPATHPVDDTADRATWLARADEQRAEIERILAAPDEGVQHVFQPIVDLRTGAVTSYEALSRFADSRRPPNAWFAQAHRCGLGIELELTAVRAQLATPGRPAGTRLSLNLSPSTLMSTAGRLALSGDLSHLVIEVTEDELVTEGTALESHLSDLRRRGAELAVDDVGAGYAGLKQVVRLKPDILKLDRSLVDGVTTDPAKGAMVDALVRYSRRIGATVCAEGIESLDDLRTLADLDVAYGQGFALGRPSPPWEPVAPAAAEVCASAHSAVIRHDLDGRRVASSFEMRLERVCFEIGGVVTAADLRQLLEPIRELLNVDEVALSLIDPANETLRTMMSEGGAEDDAPYPLADYPATVALFDSGAVLQVLASDPLADRAERAILAELGYGALLVVPLLAGAEPVGVLEAYTRDEQPWSRAQIHRARIVGYQLGRVLSALAERPKVVAWGFAQAGCGSGDCPGATRPRTPA